MDMDTAMTMVCAGWVVRRPHWPVDVFVRRHATHPNRFAGPEPTFEDTQAEDWETVGRVQ